MSPALQALIVESSEADAYRSLAQCAHAENEDFVAKEVGGGVAIVAPSVTTSLNLNRVIGLGLTQATTAAHLDQIEALYRPHGLSFGIEVGPSVQPPDLGKWLRARGIRRGFATAMLLRDVAEVNEPEDGVQVRRVGVSEAQIAARIFCETFRMPKACERLFFGIHGSERWRQWIAYIGSTPVGACLSFVGESATWCGWCATVGEFRGRGVHAAMIARRINDAWESGSRYATAETAMSTPARPDPSFRNYEKLGFNFAYERNTYISLHADATAQTR